MKGDHGYAAGPDSALSGQCSPREAECKIEIIPGFKLRSLTHVHYGGGHTGSLFQQMIVCLRK